MSLLRAQHNITRLKNTAAKISSKVPGVGVGRWLHLSDLESRWHQTSIAKLGAKRQWMYISLAFFLSKPRKGKGCDIGIMRSNGRAMREKPQSDCKRKS